MIFHREGFPDHRVEELKIILIDKRLPFHFFSVNYHYILAHSIFLMLPLVFAVEEKKIRGPLTYLNIQVHVLESIEQQRSNGPYCSR